jgi:hypothetical protein
VPVSLTTVTEKTQKRFDEIEKQMAKMNVSLEDAKEQANREKAL